MNDTKHDNGMYTWPTLYRTAKTGRWWQWEVCVIPTPYIDGVTAGIVRVLYGRVGVGDLQTYKVVFSAGKPTPMEAARAWAEKLWLKKKFEGYAGDVTPPPRRPGGWRMLAHPCPVPRPDDRDVQALRLAGHLEDDPYQLE